MQKHIKKILDNVNTELSSLIKYEFDSTNLQQRGIADVLEKKCCDAIVNIQSKDMTVERAKTKRSMEDVQVWRKGVLAKFDIKTHEIGTEFSMPNLVSVDKLKTFYDESPNNYLFYIFLDYTTLDNVTTVKDIDVRLVEEIDWSNLAIQNLGIGQLQIKDNNKRLAFTNPSREYWMGQLCDNMLVYYDNLINKIQTKWRPKWENTRWTTEYEHEKFFE